jgi:two-component system copper resistance phosphate regulon response regulator CusR
VNDAEANSLHILLIDDDPKLGDLLTSALGEEGHVVNVAATAAAGLAELRNHEPDVVLLDVMLPDQDGLEVCRALRKQGLSIPILLLTALDDTSDVIDGLDSGADDHLAKPFEVTELSARIRALVRRHRKSEPTVLTFQDLRMDLAKRSVSRAGKKVGLTAKEFELLEYLARNPNRVLSRSAISERVWNLGLDTESNVIDVCISTLRSKIDKPFENPLIHTVIGTGYMLSAEGPPA